MKARQALVYICLGLFACLVSLAAVFGPSAILQHNDNTVLNNITLEEKDADVEGYRYYLSADEKLYVLSNALNNRITPQSDYFAAIRVNDSISDVRIQSYAFQPVYNETAFNDETCGAALGSLRDELAALAGKNILPEIDFAPEDGAYDAVLYSAIDVLEPKSSVEVWHISFGGLILREGLVECVMDAQTGKIYSVSLRADKSWEEYDSDDIIRLWAEYLGVSPPEPYAPGSALSESATHYSKYAINGVEDEKTFVTVGYFDGIREFFIKISK